MILCVSGSSPVI
ncbi:hypothetical protein D018_4276A, partial [Vibrio parahaemolyticus VP2007-007]